MRFDNLYIKLYTHLTRQQGWQPKLFSWEALYVFHKYHEVNFENIIFKAASNCSLYKTYWFSTPQQVLSFYSLFSKSFLYLPSLLALFLPFPTFLYVICWHYLALALSRHLREYLGQRLGQQLLCLLLLLLLHLHLLAPSSCPFLLLPPPFLPLPSWLSAVLAVAFCLLCYLFSFMFGFPFFLFLLFHLLLPFLLSFLHIFWHCCSCCCCCFRVFLFLGFVLLLRCLFTAARCKIFLFACQKILSIFVPSSSSQSLLLLLLQCCSLLLLLLPVVVVASF